MRILVTGGAGFVGRFLCRELLERGHFVRVLDALLPQVHGDLASAESPTDTVPLERRGRVPAEVEFLHGDVRDGELVDRALEGIDGVVHLAAEVGIGQSMYEVDRYVDGNTRGTARLWERLIAHPPRGVVVASSMAVYGEGACVDGQGRAALAPRRLTERLQDRHWEPTDAAGEPLWAVPTAESHPARPTSIYALTKLDQELQSLILGAAYGIPATALRFFNIYGPGQSLHNPYAGVVSIFAARLLAGGAPELFEDGGQRRDFVHVKDVARACRLAVEQLVERGLQAPCCGQPLNIGSGKSISIGELAARLATAFGRPDLEPVPTGHHRAGDIRHCFADTSAAARTLGFEARVDMRDGLEELARSIRAGEAGSIDDRAVRELRDRGLVT
jgi:dTDP-L-rhamnose 4-epimerase